MQLKVPEKYLSSYSDIPHIIGTVVDEGDIEVSTKSDKFFCPSQDDSQSEISVQVPLDSDITSSAIYPSFQHVGEEGSEDLKVEGEPEEEIKSDILEIETPMQDQAVDQMEVDATERPLQVLRETRWQSSLKEMNVGSESHEVRDLNHCIRQDAKVPDLESLSVKEPEMYPAIYDAKVRSEISRENEAGLMVEHVHAGGVEVSGITPTQHPYVVTHQGPTGKDVVTQSLPLTSDPEVSVHHRQRQGQGSMLKDLPAVLCVDADTESASERTPLKESGPVLTSISKPDTSPELINVKAVSPEDKDRDPCSTEDELITHKEFEEEFKLFHNNPAPLQIQESLESQLPLPSKTLAVSSAQPEVVLGQTLIPAIAIFCTAVCLVVGLQEPSMFLVLGLFLVSFCF
ncbi:hypothetical protein MHYP_G00324230 [Metynnis hypsauchen]